MPQQEPPGTTAQAEQCRAIVGECVQELGEVDVLVDNAAHQMSHESLEEISDEEWLHTLDTNLSASSHLSKAALPHTGPGSSIIGSSSVNSDNPEPTPIPSTMPAEQVESFGRQAPLGRPGQPAELAPVYVLLASDDGSCVSGARVAVTGGTPVL